MNDVKAELTVRLVERNELEQVNVLRGQVNRLTVTRVPTCLRRDSATS